MPGASGQANWIAYADWLYEADDTIKRFSTTWKVPKAPRIRNSQVIYLFCGMQNVADDILQPVLQWGRSPHDVPGTTGPFWTVASFFVPTSGQAKMSAHVPVNEDEALTGVITFEGQVGESFNYRCEFLNKADTVLFPDKPIPKLDLCVETLEAYYVPNPGGHYDLDDADEYPAVSETVFDSIKIVTSSGQVPSGSWEKVTNAWATHGEAVKVYRSDPQDSRVGIGFGQQSALMAGTSDAGAGLTLASAKAGLAQTFGVAADAIDIHIRG